MRFPHQEVSDPGAQRNFEFLQQSGLYWGSGAPAFVPPVKGAYYFRQDTPTTVNQRVYIWSGSAWSGIL